MYTKPDTKAATHWSVAERLVYLDQSFLSSVCFREDLNTENLLLKLKKLQATKRIALVVSDIHCRETSAFPERYANRMEHLWRFQNDLVAGRIAANWRDVLVAQHRRLLSENGTGSYPVSDIQLREPPQPRLGVRIVMTNSWMLRMHRGTASQFHDDDSSYREVIDRQVKNIPRCRGVEDCLMYVRELWRTDIRAGIVAWRERKDFTRAFERFGNSPNIEQLVSLKIPELRDTPYLQFINDVARGLDGDVVLRKWSDLLEKDPIGPCPSLRIRTAFEAELLWTRYQGKRSSSMRFRENFGRSRQYDIDHVSAFVPYVGALTTDKDMHNLCTRQIVDSELRRFPCRIFSSKNYGEFGEWLDKLF